jgi:hypothetical protein
MTLLDIDNTSVKAPSANSLKVNNTLLYLVRAVAQDIMITSNKFSQGVDLNLITKHKSLKKDSDTALNLI